MAEEEAKTQVKTLSDMEEKKLVDSLANAVAEVNAATLDEKLADIKGETCYANKNRGKWMPRLTC